MDYAARLKAIGLASCHLIALLLCSSCLPVSAEEPVAEVSLAQLVRHRSYHRTLASVLLKNEKLDEAAEAFEEAVGAGQMILAEVETAEERDEEQIALRRRELEDDLDQLATLYATHGLFTAAAKVNLDLLELKIQAYGKDNYRVWDTRLRIEDLLRLRTLPDEVHEALRTRVPALLAEIEQKRQEKQHEEALRLAEELKAIVQQAWGEGHTEFASVLHLIGGIHVDRGELVEGERHLREGMLIRVTRLGWTHPQTADHLRQFVEALDRFAAFYMDRAIFEQDRDALKEAHRLRREALEKRELLLGENDPDVVHARLVVEEVDRILQLTPEELARYVSYEQRRLQAARKYKDGDRAGAIAAYAEALQMARETVGERNRSVLALYGSLSALHALLREYEDAIEFAQRASELAKQLLGPEHPGYRENAEWLSKMWSDWAREQGLREEFDGALKAQQQALKTIHDLYGDEHWQTTDARLAAKHWEQLASLSEAQRQRLNAIAQLEARNFQLPTVQLLDTGVNTGEQILAVRTEILGADSRVALESMELLASLYEQAGDYARAGQLFQACYERRLNVLGERHPDTARSLSFVGDIYRTQGDFDKARAAQLRAAEILIETKGRKDPQTARALGFLAAVYHQLGGYPQALELYHEALGILQEAHGLADRRTQIVGINLTRLYYDQGDYEPAKQIGLQLLSGLIDAQRDQAFEQLSTAVLINSIGDTYRALGDYAEAERMLKTAVSVCQRTVGLKHPKTAECLINLGLTYVEMGHFPKADDHFVYATEIVSATYGEEHQLFAKCLEHRAYLLRLMGDFDKAESLFLNAWRIFQQTYGDLHPDLGPLFTKLTVLKQLQGDYVKAVDFARFSYEINQNWRGDDHPMTALARQNHAVMLLLAGRLEEAEALFHETLLSMENSLGPEHPLMAQVSDNVVFLHLLKREQPKAIAELRRVVALRRRVYGEDHPGTVQSLMSLAYLDQEDTDPELVRLFRVGLRNLQSTLDITSNIQSEQQQLETRQFYRGGLDSLLTMASRMDLPGDQVYGILLPWKGAVFMRQRRLRLARQHPELEAQFAELEALSRKMSALLFADPASQDAAETSAQLAALGLEKEFLEQQIARASDEFRAEREIAGLQPVDLQKDLPENAALVDFIAYPHDRLEPGQDGRLEMGRELRLLAFVVRPDHPIQMMPLGPLEPIEQAIDAWRMSLAQGSGDISQRQGPQHLLRQQLLEPLRPHLNGVQLLLLSPDDCLGRCPFAALPGNDPDKYLIEETGVAVIPVPQLLPSLLEDRPSTEQESELPSMLLVGGVDFDKQAAEGSAEAVDRRQLPGQVRAGDLQAWASLPGTAREAALLQETLLHVRPNAEIRMLDGPRANEAAIRAEVTRKQFVHLATHGFFAPAAVRSALGISEVDAAGGFAAARAGDRQASGFHPGLLSGIVLAGANAPAAPGQEDGILTALEVAGLDLRGTRLVNLSACETGLGRSAGGEGVLGLQRAFQVAGARTTVTSLWNVDDRATQTLMVEFYRNLWEHQQGTLESLRQAQLAMLRRYQPASGRLRGATDLDAPQPGGHDDRLPPFFWAAFQLSGDWR